jgi:hypothetical protein
MAAVAATFTRRRSFEVVFMVRSSRLSDLKVAIAFGKSL